MNREDILRMAREADLYLDGENTQRPLYVLNLEELERFAALVAAAAKLEMLMAGHDEWLEEARKAEREACAKVCEEMYRRDGFAAVECEAADECAAAIRARSST